MHKFRADRTRPAIEGDALSRMPTAPKWLGKEGKKLWKDAARDLLNRGRLYTVGLHILQQYCESYQIYCNATQEIFNDTEKGEIAVKDGDALRKNPIYQIRSKALEEMNKLEKLLGFSPYSRDRITVAEPEDEGDPMEDL